MTDLHPDIVERAARAIESGWGNPDTFVGKVSDTSRRDATVVLEAVGFEALQARLDAVRQLIEQGYPGVNKTDQCEHGKYGFEDCIACYDEALTKALNGERM